MKHEQDALFDILAEDGLDGLAVELDLLGVVAADLFGGGVAVGLVVEQDEAAVGFFEEDVDDALDEDLLAAACVGGVDLADGDHATEGQLAPDAHGLLHALFERGLAEGFDARVVDGSLVAGGNHAGGFHAGDLCAQSLAREVAVQVEVLHDAVHERAALGR